MGWIGLAGLAATAPWLLLLRLLLRFVLVVLLGTIILGVLLRVTLILRLVIRFVFGCFVLGLVVVLVLGFVVLVLLFLLLLFLLLALHIVLVGLHDLAVLDPTAPALDLIGVQHGARHHVARELLEVRAHSPPLGPPDVSGLLEESLRVVLDHQHDASHRR